MKKQKLLLLSITGIKNQEENPIYLNPFLSSLKKLVIKNFKVKVLLFDTSSYNTTIEKSKTYRKIVKYGLKNHVELINIHSDFIPETSRDFIKNSHWFSSIGHLMNLLFDLASSHNFYNSDWIFHTDTDIYFKENFISVISKLNFSDEIFLSVAGDAYPFHFSQGNDVMLLKSPKRVSLLGDNVSLNDLEISNYYDVDLIKSDNKASIPSVVESQLKIRNDFVGISKKTALKIKPNWVSYSLNNDTYSEVYGVRLFSHKDKGSSVFYDLKEGYKHGYSELFHLQVPDGFMHHHFSSGFSQIERFLNDSFSYMVDEHSDFKKLWFDDYKLFL